MPVLFWTIGLDRRGPHHPPVPLALAKAVEAVPTEGALPGGAVFEPKWDGYRL